MNKFQYFLDSLKRFGSDKKCPNCGGTDLTERDRKYFFFRLFQCNDCYLLFRHPKDNIASNMEFYQIEYEQPDGITTQLPKDAISIDDLIDSNLQKSTSEYIEIISFLFTNKKNIKLTDYGCSWGYMTYQFANADFDVQGFEISKPRAQFGKEKLGLNIIWSERDLLKNQDVVFSSHVIEHLPSIPHFIETSKELLNDDGVFIAICPNGSEEFQRNKPYNFHKMWGQVHPNVLSAKFYQNLFKDNPCLIYSSPFKQELVYQWDKRSQIVGDLSGDNLIVLSYINRSF